MTKTESRNVVLLHCRFYPIALYDVGNIMKISGRMAAVAGVAAIAISRLNK